jgi:hypothetical protein
MMKIESKFRKKCVYIVKRCGIRHRHDVLFEVTRERVERVKEQDGRELIETQGTGLECLHCFTFKYIFKRVQYNYHETSSLRRPYG